MKARDIDEFAGIAYGQMDCVELMVRFQAKHFNRFLLLPTDREVVKREARRLLRDHVELTDSPKVGDLVLMKAPWDDYPEHVGTWLWFSGEAWVLHTTPNTDSACHRVRQLGDFGIVIEGVYTWKTS